MRLVAYQIKKRVRIEPAPTTRQWMDEWPHGHPYHCLPLVVANSYGWQLLCSTAFEATWTGHRSKGSVVVKRVGEKKGSTAYSHFGGGVLTFDPGCLLRTEAPTELFVGGPINMCKHGICPLSGIVETSWLSFTFTMNWRFTAPDITVRFDEGEPFCHFFPIAPAAIDQAEPEIRDLSSDPVLFRRYHELRLSRQLSNGLKFTETGMVKTRDHAYEHHYHDGESAQGERLAPKPRRRFTVRPFARMTDASTSAQSTYDDPEGASQVRHHSVRSTGRA